MHASNQLKGIWGIGNVFNYLFIFKFWGIVPILWVIKLCNYCLNISDNNTTSVFPGGHIWFICTIPSASLSILKRTEAHRYMFKILVKKQWFLLNSGLVRKGEGAATHLVVFLSTYILGHVCIELQPSFRPYFSVWWFGSLPLVKITLRLFCL